jgi:membrane-associated phospholipid phosphatase
MMVFGAWMLIAPALLPRWAVGLVWVVCLVAIAVTGISRSWSGAHWPSDWLGAFVLGLAVLLLLHAAMPLLARWLDRSQRNDGQGTYPVTR